MKTLTTFILAGALALLAQPNQLDLRQDPPTAVQSERVSSAYTGTAGATTYYYWVVTRYPIGFIVPTAPVVVGGASALGGGNSVALGWPAMTGASSYDVLRTTTNAAPSSCTCAVVLATTGTTLTDNGGALSAWPPGGLNSAGVAQAELQINNRDAGAPYITMAVRNAQRILNYQLGILKNGTAPSYVPSGFIQPYSNAQGAFSCVDSTGADCMATRPGPTNYCDDVGAVNAYACSFAPAITTYAVGNSYRFKAAAANTGPSTVNFNGLGVVAIKTAAGGDPLAGSIGVGQMVDLVYTGSVMQMPSTSGITYNINCAGNGIADDTACFQGVLTQAGTTGGTVMVPLGTFLVSSTITIPNKVRVLGSGRGDANSYGTVIKASASFPVSSAIVNLGAISGGTAQHGTQIEELTIDCSAIAGATGIYSNRAQEQSWARKILITRCGGQGIWLSQTQNDGPYEDLEILPEDAGVAATIGVRVDGTNGHRGFRSVSIVNSSYTAKPDVCLRTYGVGGVLQDVHMEGCDTGMLIGPVALGGQQGLTLINVDGDSTVTTAVDIDNNSNNQNITAIAIRGASTNVLRDQTTGVTITSAVHPTGVGIYTVGDGAIGSRTYFSTNVLVNSKLISSLTLTDILNTVIAPPGAVATHYKMDHYFDENAGAAVEWWAGGTQPRSRMWNAINASGIGELHFAVGNGSTSLATPQIIFGSTRLEVAGTMKAALFDTITNCSSAASPAVCAAASAGSVAVAAAATSVVVNTTAVTADSQVLVTFDSSLGTKLGVTCNTTPVQPTVSARTAATSFTITVPSAPATDPACFSYSIIN